jgi:hypothetical protein
MLLLLWELLTSMSPVGIITIGMGQILPMAIVKITHIVTLFVGSSEPLRILRPPAACEKKRHKHVVLCPPSRFIYTS